MVAVAMVKATVEATVAVAKAVARGLGGGSVPVVAVKERCK